MNYKRIHDSIIYRAVNRSLPSGYTEKHHIIPLSMGGKEDEDWIVFVKENKREIS
ncbi:homing endonuclease [Salmonella phage allotria]|uniref:Homing endonuclease n=3 Tax=Kuttervirus TaxID=2169536 RepID=A0A6G8RM25_9CAUD|nr:homing endonuclease [Salmonella phage allotria]YP_009889024.1 homing endonuclease [Salmonella phage pertopsoe]YP_009889222.1 homing endonuclease [Salmonella phage maane]QPX74821.1 putative homing endonuclease [Salmonella phage SilasIsHot]WDR21163.1 hypothetical protein PJM37_0084 [Salmonella phage vB_SenM_UTK0004]WNM70793.1 homing endonuclease [Salmonella phage Mansal]QIO02422.1 homing endonuclease [Salmonella phage allotria]QIO03296.1 homing endonuclease [Salmonella phage pertopsoe]